MKTIRLVIFSLLISTVAVCCISGNAAAQGQPAKNKQNEKKPVTHESVSILRDTYGVPHVFADSTLGGFYGLGWTEAEDLGHIMYMEILGSQGRVSEFFTPSSSENLDAMIEKDIEAKAYGFYDSAANWKLLPGDVKDILCAYTNGFNDYIESVSRSGKLAGRYKGTAGYNYSEVMQKYGKISIRDVVAMLLMKNNSESLLNLSPAEKKAINVAARPESAGGSNAVAITDARTEYNGPILYGDPHNLWDEFQNTVSLVSPNLQIFGTFFGPISTDGIFNSLAVAHTRNFPDGTDVFKLKVKKNEPEKYFYNGKWLDMIKKGILINIKGKAPLKITVYYSLHGWIRGYDPIKQATDPSNTAYAIRVSTGGLSSDSIPSLNFVTQRIRLMQAKTVAEFYDVGRRPYIAQDTFVLADEKNNIAYMWYGVIPVRRSDLNYKITVDTTQPLEGWTITANWLDNVWSLGDPDFPLPFVLNPPDGYIRSANDAPWRSWGCADSNLRPANIPYHVVPKSLDSTPRGVLLKSILCSKSVTNIETLQQKIAFDTFSPHSSDFVHAIENGWNKYKESIMSVVKPSPDALKLDGMLRSWNFRADIDQKGMTVMFHLRRLTFLPPFDSAYTPSLSEMSTYLNDLEMVASIMKKLYGRLDVPWGDIHIISRGGKNIPLPGGTVKLPTLMMANMGTYYDDFMERENDAMYGDFPNQTDKNLIGKIICNFGSSFIHAHVMDPANPVTMYITPQGQIDALMFPASKHLTQQTELFANKQWVKLPQTREEVEKNLCPWGKDPAHEHPDVTKLEITLPFPYTD